MKTALQILANAILPADELDAGAAAVNAAERIGQGVHAQLYEDGIAFAEKYAREELHCEIGEIDGARVGDLIEAIRERMPAFFTQLRMDVCAIYMSDPDVWARIGFPGPSTATGGYPDFAEKPGALKVQ